MEYKKPSSFNSEEIVKYFGIYPCSLIGFLREVTDAPDNCVEIMATMFKHFPDQLKDWLDKLIQVEDLICVTRRNVDTKGSWNIPLKTSITSLGLAIGDGIQMKEMFIILRKDLKNNDERRYLARTMVIHPSLIDRGGNCPSSLRDYDDCT